MKSTYLVTGATGTVGRHLVDQLLRDGHHVRALTRDPAGAKLPAAVEVVAGDLTDAASLPFDGVTAAHLINFGDGYRPLDNGAEIVERAVLAGVRRVTMLGGWAEGTLEPAVRASALAWTALQPIEFMGNTLADWGWRLRRDRVVREPYGDRRSAPVHEGDIAVVAAVALTKTGHSGQSYVLTGPEVLTPRVKMSQLAAATGLDLRFEELTPEQTRREWTVERPDLLFFRIADDGPEAIEMLLRVYGDVPEYGWTVSDAVPAVTGRPARTFAEWAAEHADGFRS